jgi:hypothetical protein
MQDDEYVVVIVTSHMALQVHDGTWEDCQKLRNQIREKVQPSTKSKPCSMIPIEVENVMPDGTVDKRTVDIKVDQILFISVSKKEEDDDDKIDGPESYLPSNIDLH